MKIRPVKAEVLHTDGQTDRQTDETEATNLRVFPPHAILRRRLKLLAHLPKTSTFSAVHGSNRCLFRGL